MPNVSPVIAYSPLLCWFVKVCVEDRRGRTLYALGPVESWSKARNVALRWEREHGPNTAHVTYRQPNDPRWSFPKHRSDAEVTAP